MRAPLISLLGPLSPLAAPRVAIPFASASAVVFPIMQRTTHAAAALAAPDGSVWARAADTVAAVRTRVRSHLAARLTATPAQLPGSLSRTSPQAAAPPLLLRPFHYSRAAFASVTAFRIPLPALPRKAAYVAPPVSPPPPPASTAPSSTSSSVHRHAFGRGAASGSIAAAPRPVPVRHSCEAPRGSSPPCVRPGMGRVLSAQRVQDAGRPLGAPRPSALLCAPLLASLPRAAHFTSGLLVSAL